MFIKVSHSITAALVGFVLTSGPAAAESVPPSRSDVKAETRAAQKAGQLIPAGEGTVKSVKPEVRSSKTRAERKASTLAAKRADEIRGAGEEPEWKTTRAAARTPSTTTRAERKAKTLVAAKSGQLTPAGEGADVPRH